jgi:aspartate racemase
VDAAVEAGAGCVVMGCTELSVIVDRFELRADERIVDSLTELARATVLAAGRELTPAFC